MLSKVILILAVYWYAFVAVAGIAVALRLIFGAAGD